MSEWLQLSADADRYLDAVYLMGWNDRIRNAAGSLSRAVTPLVSAYAAALSQVMRDEEPATDQLDLTSRKVQHALAEYVEAIREG